jgi:hypothetical protein
MIPKRQDLEGYENHLTTLLKQGVGAAATGNVDVRLQDVSGRLEWRWLITEVFSAGS